MNNQEAKLILHAYRPNGRDAADPMFAEALEQARRDPELQQWFANETALNTRIQERLITAVPMPSELKSNLLALRKTVRPASWWHRPMNLAAAAAILFLAGIAFILLPNKQGQVVSFREAMAEHSLQTEGHVVFESHQIADIRRWLQDRGFAADFNLPAMLQGGTPQGCRVVDWNGHKATMVCFMLEGQHMDLFVMDRSDLPGFPRSGAPQFAKAEGLMTVMWTRGQDVYLLTGSSKEQLLKVLQQT